MTTAPFGLENPAETQEWNLDIDADGNLRANANDTALGTTRLLIRDDIGGVVITNDNETRYSVELVNSANAAFRTGMQVTNSGFFRITNQIGASPSFAQLNNTGNWTVASDRRIKHDVERASDLLEKALALNPVHFFYNGQDLATMPHKLTGFIADEVQALLPQLVTEGETKYLDYSGLIP